MKYKNLICAFLVSLCTVWGQQAQASVSSAVTVMLTTLGVWKFFVPSLQKGLDNLNPNPDYIRQVRQQQIIDGEAQIAQYTPLFTPYIKGPIDQGTLGWYISEAQEQQEKIGHQAIRVEKTGKELSAASALLPSNNSLWAWCKTIGLSGLGAGIGHVLYQYGVEPFLSKQQDDFFNKMQELNTATAELHNIEVIYNTVDTNRKAEKARQESLPEAQRQPDALKKLDEQISTLEQQKKDLQEKIKPLQEQVKTSEGAAQKSMGSWAKNLIHAGCVGACTLLGFAVSHYVTSQSTAHDPNNPEHVKILKRFNAAQKTYNNEYAYYQKLQNEMPMPADLIGTGAGLIQLMQQVDELKDPYWGFITQYFGQGIMNQFQQH